MLQTDLQVNQVSSETLFDAPLPCLLDAGFLDSLRDCLHALAQPLTLVQTRLEAALLAGGEAEMQLLVHLAEDVERACQSFHAVQHLVGRGRGPFSPEPAAAPTAEQLS